MTEGAPPPQPPQPPTGASTPPETAAAPEGYPIGYQVDYPRERNRLTTFFRIIVVIPWLLVEVVYGLLGAVFTLIAWIALIILARYPETLYRWNSGILRYSASVSGFVHLLTDEWPQFGWADDPDRPQRVLIAARADRQSRLKVFFRIILALPLLVVNWALNYLGLTGAVASWLTVVFRGYQPRWLHDAIVQVVRFQTRVSGYIGLLTDLYPPVGDDAPALAAQTA